MVLMVEKTKMVKQKISEAIVNMNTILMEERKGEEVSTLSFPRNTNSVSHIEDKYQLVKKKMLHKIVLKRN